MSSKKALLDSFEIDEVSVRCEPKIHSHHERFDEEACCSIDCINNHTAAIHIETKVGDDYLIGAMLMVMTTLMWSISHIASKAMYSRSPGITGFDTTSIQGYALVPFYYAYAKFKGINLNFFSYDNKVKMLIFLRVLVGSTSNILVYVGLKYVTVGKGILIYSLSPLFCSVTAGYFLKEKITSTSVILTLVSFGGVYLLTLNKPVNELDASMEIVGYIMILISALLYGVLFVLLRAMNLSKVNMLVSPFYYGVGTMFQTVVILLVQPSQIHFELYDSTNLIFFGFMGSCAIVGQYSMIAANKYGSASKMAPINYTENVFTLLADTILFNYHFITSDICGMAVIVACLVIPVVQKMRGSE
uniref:EamA domain-containing protein n=1 Tax=Euplotes harpa TaxID=151035 RepID=A0A7S3JG88_9SPIT|mmetsp:Transcript_39159/g.44832  ORF Transcript_39159/g.44832 Transcript_39159/m.44832 type:complete len:359 (+) Transcript_39159:20-1096(+)